MYSFKFKHLLLCLLFLFINISIYQECLADEYPDGYGKLIKPNVLLEIKSGMSKGEIRALLGTPTFIFTKNIDCLCYYYIYVPKNKNDRGYRRYVMFIFENQYLDYYTIYSSVKMSDEKNYIKYK